MAQRTPAGRLSPAIGFREPQRRVSRLASDRAIPVERLHQRIATEVLFNVLERARAAGVVDTYAIKGGMALEVRFGMRARASRDVDVSVPVPFEDVPQILDEILAKEFDDFTILRRAPLHVMARAKTYRAELDVQYKGQMFYRLRLPHAKRELHGYD